MKALAFVPRQKPRGTGTLSGRGGWLHGEQSPSPQTRGHRRPVSERSEEVKKGPVAAGRLALSYGPTRAAATMSLTDTGL